MTQPQATVTLASLSWVDYLIIALIAFSVFISLIRGFVRETLSLITWVAAFLVAFNFGNTLGDLFQNHVSSQTSRLIIGSVILFIGTLIIGAIVNYLISSLVEKTGLSSTDRVLGVALGGARGVLIVSILILLASYTSIPNEQPWKSSLLIPHFETCSNWIQGFVPQAFNFVNSQ
ncbi:MAG: CvpA family protein [Legionellales bacterium]|nr:CvpA family protein [Legionellales bacterium]